MMLRFCFLNFQSKTVHIKSYIFTLLGQLGLLEYDLIIGVNTMSKMGVKLDFSDNSISLDHVKLPMQPLSNLVNQKLLNSVHKEFVELSSIDLLTKCAVDILNANMKQQICQS